MNFSYLKFNFNSLFIFTTQLSLYNKEYKISDSVGFENYISNIDYIISIIVDIIKDRKDGLY